MNEANSFLNQVQRAAGELRRGRPVLVRGGTGERALALAAELASAQWIDQLQAWSGGAAVLALTANRARALNILPTGHPVILLPLAGRLNVDTVQTLADATTDLSRPLRGPFRRDKRAPSEAESAAITLAKIARLLPAAVVAPLTAPVDDDLIEVPAARVDSYESDAAHDLQLVSAAPVPLQEAEDARIYAFRPRDGGVEHLAIVIGEPDRHSPVLTRLHSECFTGDLLGSLKCDCGDQLRGAIAAMREAGAGVLLYLAQEGRGIGLINKLRAYRLQAEGFDTVDANLRLGFENDERLFRPAAEMLRKLGFAEVRMLTNNPQKVQGLQACGIAVVERVSHQFPSNAHNEFYLATKQRRSGHLF